MRILMMPFSLLWAFISVLFELLGRMITAILGFTLIITGVLLTLTIVGSIVGIPMVVFGILLAMRSIF